MSVPQTLRRAALSALILALCVAMLLLPAQRWDWLRGWLYVVLLLGPSAILVVLLLRRDPDLLRRRMRAGPGTKRWDRVLAPLLKLGFTLEIVLGALDAGPAGSEAMSFALWPLGTLLHLAGAWLFTWGMLANTHFESTVRLQEDQAHLVVSRGPYGWVRHPGYFGFALQILAVPLLLGSRWAFPAAAFPLIVLIWRTALEDRFLQRELEGYREYAARVRYRLFPGIW